jgi:hypothetical protein
VVTIDGNGKDGVEVIPEFIKKLEQGFDLIQGSRYTKGGEEENTPFLRHVGNHLVLAPLFSLAARFHFTDVTNGFRGYSVKLLTDQRVKPFRNVFIGYELLFYLGVRSAQLKMKVCELPVYRGYPSQGKTPTKITGFKALWKVLETGLKTAIGYYNP